MRTLNGRTETRVLRDGHWVRVDSFPIIQRVRVEFKHIADFRKFIKLEKPANTQSSE